MPILLPPNLMPEPFPIFWKSYFLYTYISLQNVNRFSSLKQAFYLIIVFSTRYPQFPANILWTMALQCLLTVHTWVEHFKITIIRKEIRSRFHVHRRIHFFSMKAFLQQINFFHFQEINLKRKKQSPKQSVFCLNIPFYLKQIGILFVKILCFFFSFLILRDSLSWQFTVHHTLNTNSNLLV